MVTPWFPTAAAPESGLFVAREAAALAAGHDMHVLHLDWTGDTRDAPLPHAFPVSRLRLRRSRPQDFARARRAVAEAAQTADVVHTHALPGLLPWLRRRPAPQPWVHSEHWSGLTAPETLGLPMRASLLLLRPRLAAPDVVVAESERLAAAIRPHRAGPTRIVPCVVPSLPTATWPDAPHLVAVGALAPRKGPLLAVQALALLRGRGHDATLTWVGDGPQREAVQVEAARRGVHGSLTLTGTLDTAGVARELGRGRLFLLPTQGDNFCVVAAEALTAGLPVVSGAATGAVDYADPTVSRFVSSPDAAAYADAVEDLLGATAGSSPAEVAATVAGRFSGEVVRAALENVYRDAGVRA